MNQSTYRISLDIHSVASQLSFGLNRGDNMRRLIITLTENGKTYEITKDCYAIFTTVKPDGKTIANDCLIQNNTIIYDFTEQTTAVAGTLDCSIIVYTSEVQRLTSPRFTVIVYETTHQNIDLTSAGEYTDLVNQVEESRQCIENANAKIEEMTNLIETVTEERDSGAYNGTSITDVQVVELSSTKSGREYSLDVTLSNINGEETIQYTFVAPRGSDGEKGNNGTSILVTDGFVIDQNPTVDTVYPFDWEDHMSVGNGQLGDAIVDGIGNVYACLNSGSTVNVKFTGLNFRGPQGPQGPQGGGVPTVKNSDNGKFLRVVNGQWAAVFVENAEDISV